MILKIAWRNIWRNPTRSIVIMMAVAIGLWAGIFLVAFTYGMVEERIKMAIEKELSHIQVHQKDYLNDYDLNFFIPNSAEIVDSISKIKEVKAVTGRTIAKGMLANASGSSGVQINGVVPEKESQVTQLKGKIKEGKYFSEKKNEILIGEKLAKKLNLKLKAKAIISFQDKEGNITSGAYRVAGIFKTNNTPYDESNVFIKADELKTIASINDFTEIAVLLNTNNDLNVVLSQLRGDFKNSEIKSWTEISPEMDLIVSVTDRSTLIYMGIIFLALAFGIINTMMMSILERTHELGMLFSLGMNKVKVFFMILSETILLIFTGAPIGLLLAFMTINYFGKRGIDLSMYSKVYESFGYSSMVYPAISAKQITEILIMVVITALASAIFPARRALKLNPVEAIRK